MVKDCILCTNPLSDIGTVTIQIIDVPEPPVVLDAVRQVVENSINGLLLDPPLQAYDPENRELTYEAVGMHMTGFPFETDQSGNIFISNRLSTERSYFTDYELKRKFFLHICCTTTLQTLLLQGF